jgi:hypothetical protein
MRGVKVQRTEHSSSTHKLVFTLAVALGILTTILLFYSTEVIGITGYSVLPELYGAAAPTFLVVCVVVLIAIYVKLVED